MSDLSPFRLLPDFKERVWGSRDLSPIYPQVPGDKPIGEAWLTGDDNRVADGPFAGATLRELCQRYGRDLVGKSAPQPDRFPLLIKFLFPRDKLSVQVHPDDDAARSVCEPCGKTECWYVLSADADAQIGLGLKPGTTCEQFVRAVEQTRAEELLNWINIHPGEMYYVEAGTVHAIGPGSILVETQQNSDTTYRLYDYGRPRELHVEQGLRAMKERTGAGKVRPILSNTSATPHVTLIASPCFAIEKYNVAEPITFDGGAGSVQILVAIEGGGACESGTGGAIAFTRGEAVVIPATTDAFSLRPQWQLECLRMFLPGEH